jgi:hypothetical protein
MRQLVLRHLLSACTRDYKFDELSHQQDMQAFRALLIDPARGLRRQSGKGRSFHKIKVSWKRTRPVARNIIVTICSALFDAFIDIPYSSRKKMIATIGRRGKALMEFSEHRKTSSNDAGYLTGQLILDVHILPFVKDRKPIKDAKGRDMDSNNAKAPHRKT